MDCKRKLKLSLLALGIILPATQAFSKPNPSSGFNSLSFGVAAGASGFFTENNSFTFLNGINHVGSDNNADVVDFGGIGALFVGTGNIYSNGIYWGLHVGANIIDANKTYMNNVSTAVVVSEDILITEITNALNVKTTVKRNTFEPFVDLKLGFLMGPQALAYFMFGINYNSIELNSEATYTSVRGLPPIGLTLQQSSLLNSTSKNVLGLRFGFGTEYLILPNFGFGLNYVYTVYNSINSNLSGPVTELTEGAVPATVLLNNHSRTKMNDQQAMAQLIFHFDS
ncbi:MAG: outer membrane beta-barrel protein [Proteobacteria bacterium]|nr:outer membrane beta-barrel protein [Pseudomonadota bacterium]